MRKILCRLINWLIRPLQLTALRQKDFAALQQTRLGITQVYLDRLRRDAAGLQDSGLACIVFSKDRALQLHALLGSMHELATPQVPVHVLFMASSEPHRQAYDEVRRLAAGRDVHFHPQQRLFRQELLALLESLDCATVFFLVDDLLFIEPVDLARLAAFDCRTHVPSLRLGLNLSRCYTLQAEQARPAAEPVPGQPELISWRWEEGEHDWGYPLSVDGHLFDRREMAIMARHAMFSAPNSFEDALQAYRDLFVGRIGVCYRKSRLVNIPCNKVQVENRNLAGTIHPDLLLVQWQQGLQMDYRQLLGVANESAHQEIPLRFTPRAPA